MPKFKVEHTTNLPASEAFQKVQNYLENSQGIRKLDPELVCSFDAGKMTGQVKGKKFNADVAVTGSGPCQVVLDIEIPLLFTPFKGQIQDTLKNKMSQILG
jgi:hypothetical protein